MKPNRVLQLVPLMLVFAALSGISTAAAQARTGNRPLEDRFRQYDRNGDGKISAEEFPGQLFKQMDTDGDGFVVPAEAREYYRSRTARQPAPITPPANVVSPERVNTPPGPAPATPPVSSSRAFTNLHFARDGQPGTKDDRGQWISGTETMRFLSHQGKLFVSTGVWMDTPYFQGKGDQPWTGPQILVKESAQAPWRVDMSFPLAIRVDAMISATFSTDGSGRKLDPPVTLLMASPSSENTATWTRDDAAGKWTESLARGELRGGLRSFCTHVDVVTKVQHLFGGSTKSGCIFRADYDAATPGKVRWHDELELSGTGRVMCMAEANGVLYAASGIKSEAPLAALHAAPSPFAKAPSATSSARSITQWAVWGPSWGRSGLSALSNGLETRIRPTPGDVSFSWGNDRRRCLAWNACEAPDGLLDFYSEGALPGVGKMAISDGAARWAGCTAYAHTYIHAETKQDVLLTVHSRRPVSMWMNGETIQRPDGQLATVHLSPGWNRLLVKVLSPSAILNGALPEFPEGPPWTLRVDLSASDGSAAKGVTMQVRDPERVADVVGPAGLPLRFLTRLSGPNGRRPLFVQDEDMALTMDVQLATGRDTKFPKNPWDRFRGEAWTYTSSPDAGSEGIIQRPSLELTKAAPVQAAIALFDFDGKCVIRKQVDLAFKLDTNGMAVATFPVHSGSLPVGYYSLTTDFLDTKGKVVARDHEHGVSVVWGPVAMSKDATPRKLSCVGHWLAASALPVGLEQLGWLHRVGVTKHQKISLAWSAWGVRHDGKGHVTVGDAPTVDALIGKANELGIKMVGDLTFGSVRSDAKRGGENMALTAGEQEEARRQARIEKEATGIRLQPYGAAPLPPFGDPAFEKTLHDYAFRLVTKYKDRIKLWAGDNEIDLHSGGASPAVATVYARASRILYEAMKEADPTAQFVTASLVRRSPFTDELIRQGFAQFTDHIDVHAHPFAAPAIADSVIGNTGSEGLGVLQQLAKKQPLSVYYGEVSAPLAHAPNGVVGQAEGIHKQLAWALKKPAVKALSYLVLYSSGAQLGFCNIYGDPLPANNAINVAAHLLDGRRILADLEGLPKGVEQIRTLGTDGRETLLLWSRTPTTITLPCPASEIELVDVIGRRSRRGVAGGVLTLRVDASPLYIVLRR